MEKYYADTWINVVDNLNSDIHKGLNEYDCIIRREEENNKIELDYTKGKFNIIIEVLKEKYLYIYLAIIIILIIEKHYIMGMIIFLLLIINIGVKLYNEIYYENEVGLLQNLNKVQVLVIREGIERLVETEELVKGDIVCFKKNSVIGADIRIIDSNNLRVDEIGVTGDSLIKEKDSIKLDRKVKNISEITNMLFRGSIIKEGSGKGIVVEVGNNTEFGRIVKIIKNKNKNLLIKSLENNILKIVLSLLLFQIMITLILPGKFLDKRELLIQGLFSIVAIPIPIILIQYNKYLRKKILRENKIEINNLSILKVINNIKIIFINKFGNITKDKLYVDKLYTNEQIYTINKIDCNDINIRRLIDISILCNNGIYNRENDSIKGTEFEEAYIRFAFENSIYKERLDGINKRRFQIPISKDRNIATTLNKYKKYYRANIRGSVENIIERCTHILVNGIEREIKPEDLIQIKLADLNFAKEGLITEGFAYRSFNYEPSIQENIESNLVFVGIIALENPIIEDIAMDIDLLIRSKILPIIFTDNNKISAEILGKRISLINNEEMIICEEDLIGLDKEEFLKKISKARIYCNLSLAMKNKIVSLYEKDGYDFLIEGNSLVDLSLITSSTIGVVKSKISKLLKILGDIYTEENTIKSFISLKEIALNIQESINRGLFTYIIITLANLIFINLNYILSMRTYEKNLNIIIMNFLIMPWIILLNSMYGKLIKSNKSTIIKALIYIIIPIGGVIISKENYNIIYFATITLMSIIDIFINSNLFKKENLIGFKFILFLIIGLGILISINIIFFKLSLDIISLIIIAWLLIIFLICDFIMKKCQ